MTVRDLLAYDGEYTTRLVFRFAELAKARVPIFADIDGTQVSFKGFSKGQSQEVTSPK